jgi:hypothetical protein
MNNKKFFYPSTNAKLLNDFLEQKEKFEDIESVVNASSTLNRELYVGGVSDEMSGGLEAVIRFWNRLDEQENIPVEERTPIKLYIDSWVLIPQFQSFFQYDSIAEPYFESMFQKCLPVFRDKYQSDNSQHIQVCTHKKNA